LAFEEDIDWTEPGRWCDDAIPTSAIFNDVSGEAAVLASFRVISEDSRINERFSALNNLDMGILQKSDVGVFDFEGISDRLTSEGHHLIPFLLYSEG
jgi:hypothetical protein